MMRCITIDDSPLALDLLDNYIGRVPYLQLVKRCTSAVEAAEIIRGGNIDLVFIDIQMPDITGIDLLRSLSVKPKVIFTTAYPNYALEGFNLNAIDYLLKPFSFERFKLACDKALHIMELEKSQRHSDLSIFIKSGYDTVKIPVQNIQYIEALRDYIQVFTPEKKILALMSMKEILDLLPPGQFARVHRSYIIPFNRITKVSTKKVMLGSKEVPIGEIYKDEFYKALKEKNILH